MRDGDRFDLEGNHKHPDDRQTPLWRPCRPLQENILRRWRGVVVLLELDASRDTNNMVAKPSKLIADEMIKLHGNALSLRPTPCNPASPSMGLYARIVSGSDSKAPALNSSFHTHRLFLQDNCCLVYLADPAAKAVLQPNDLREGQDLWLHPRDAHGAINLVNYSLHEVL